MKTKQLSLEALKSFVMHGTCMDADDLQDGRKAIAALEADIAQGGEPVAWLMQGKFHGRLDISSPNEKATNPKFWTDAFPVYTTPQEPAPRTPYGWQVQGLRDTFKGDHAEQDAKAEAARIGGTAYAFPIYIDTPKATA